MSGEREVVSVTVNDVPEVHCPAALASKDGDGPAALVAVRNGRDGARVSPARRPADTVASIASLTTISIRLGAGRLKLLTAFWLARSIVGRNVWPGSPGVLNEVPHQRR